MTLTEFDNKYDFHDSSLESICFDQDNNILEMNIDFCFWMQTDYIKTSPEIGMIKLIFKDVQSFNGESVNYNNVTILKVNVSSHHQITFYTLDEDRDEFIELTIVANAVDFVVP